jgi:hypothetical protein
VCVRSGSSRRAISCAGTTSGSFSITASKI